MFLTDRSHLPDAVTSYDVWKTLAVLLMIIDHIGAYFLPDEQGLRILGRLCVPIWFFLVGYAQSRDLSWRLWGGVAILSISNYIGGQPIFPLTILATIIFIRLILDRFMVMSMRSPKDMFMACGVILLLFLPSNALLEYGTSGLAFAVIGYLARQKDTLQISKESASMLLFAAVAFFVVTQAYGFGFAYIPSLVVFMGSGVYLAMLYFTFGFEKTPASNLLNISGVRQFLQICGRYTLEIYVLHLAIFKIMATAFGPLELYWFEFRLFVGS